MTALLLVTLVCAVLLALTGSLPPWASILLILASLGGMAIQTRFRMLEEKQLNRRRQVLGAAWGIAARHLGGLPLPLDTTGRLFLLHDNLLLESEHDQLTIRLDDLRQIVLTTTDQIRKMPDRKICGQLAAGSCRTFAALRDKIRHHDSTLIGHGLLLIVYSPSPDEGNLLILATSLSPASLTSLLQHPALAGKADFGLPLGQQPAL